MSDVAFLIENFCDTTSDCRFRSNYSGRYMYGKTCVGIDIDSLRLSMLIELTEYLMLNGIPDVAETLGRVCYDNMGKNYIIYFPGLSC